jgi:hypothetical protein
MSISRTRLRVSLFFALAALGLAAPAGAAGADPFTGVWASPDTDGDFVRFAISAPDAQGNRHLTGFDPAAEACAGGPATAFGVGTVTGDTLTTTLTVRCSGTIHFVGAFYFTAIGGTLISDTSLAPYTRVGSGG